MKGLEQIKSILEVLLVDEVTLEPEFSKMLVTAGGRIAVEWTGKNETDSLKASVAPMSDGWLITTYLEVDCRWLSHDVRYMPDEESMVQYLRDIVPYGWEHE